MTADDARDLALGRNVRAPTERQIASAAIAWDNARRDALRLKRARNAFVCEEEEASEPDVHFLGTPPCWKTDVDAGYGQVKRLAREKWCEPCRSRQAIHEEYLAANRLRGACLRSMQRVCGNRLKALAAREGEVG